MKIDLKPIEKEIEGTGFWIARVENRSKHRMLVLESSTGRSIRITLARSPSDYRSGRNAIAIVRREIRNASLR